MATNEPDRNNLRRFVLAQDRDGVYQDALAELRAGLKTSHWMWFVFPQVAGLCRTEMATTYAIESAAEARAYLAHPVLGPRLIECAHALTAVAGRSAEQILGGIDAMKLRSSMTLFEYAGPGQPVFDAVLDLYFAGQRDELTERLLAFKVE